MPQTKARYWCAVLYPENMIDDWEIKIGDLITFPYCYCIHDQDVDKEGETRKTHVHIMIAYTNTVAQGPVMKLLERLNAPGKNAFNTIQTVNNVRHMYNYLIHDTDACRKQGKHIYMKEERISGNNFDIGDFEQVSIAEKRRRLKEVCDFVVEQNITNFTEAYIYVTKNFGEEYFEIFATYSGLISRITKGNFLKSGNLKS